MWACHGFGGNALIEEQAGAFHVAATGSGWFQARADITRTHTTLEGAARAACGDDHDPPVPYLLAPGMHFPRVWRGEGDRRNMNLWDEYAFRRATDALPDLVEELRRVFRVVEPERENMDAYGHRLRHLLILAATEVESSLKAILAANGYERAGHWNRIDYARLAVPLRLGAYSWRLRVASEDPYITAPFAGWGPDDQRALAWYDAYNRVKHDRESTLHLATLAHAIDATAAAMTLCVAQFGFHEFKHGGIGEAARGLFQKQELPHFPVQSWYCAAAGGEEWRHGHIDQLLALPG